MSSIVVLVSGVDLGSNAVASRSVQDFPRRMLSGNWIRCIYGITFSAVMQYNSRL